MTDALTAVVLAGGRSRRFGAADKLLAPLADRSLIAHAVETVRGISDAEPVVATRDRAHERSLADAVEGGVRFVRDDGAFAGPLAGIAAAHSVVETPRLFVCGGDMPRISTAAVSTLRARAGAAVVPVVDGRVEPLHAIYGREPLAAALRRVPSDSGPRALLETLESVAYVRDGDAATPLAASTVDVDTRADLEAVLRDRTDPVAVSTGG